MAESAEIAAISFLLMTMILIVDGPTGLNPDQVKFADGIQENQIADQRK